MIHKPMTKRGCVCKICRRIIQKGEKCLQFRKYIGSGGNINDCFCDECVSKLYIELMDLSIVPRIDNNNNRPYTTLSEIDEAMRSAGIEAIP